MSASPSVAMSRSARLFAAIREAVGGTRQDFTEGSLGRAIMLLAVPMVLEMIMESLFGVVNVFFVARLGSDAVSAVGMTESVLTILYTVAMGLSIATTATVARRIGEKDPAGARASASQAIGAGVIVSIVAGTLGARFAPQLLRAMGAWPSLLEAGSAYTSLMLGGAGTIVLLFLLNAIFRGAGDAAIAMRSLWLANLVNILLVPCLVVGWGPFPKMGLTGAALGTTIGRAVGVAYQCWSLFRGGGRVVLRLENIRFQAKLMLDLLRISLPGMFQYGIATASWLGLVRIVATYGSAALAGYTIAIRVFVFAILPSWGMANAAATLVGQNLGAGKPGRAEQAVWRTGFYNMIFLGSVAIAFIAFAGPVIRVFTHDPEVIAAGTDCLRFISYGYPFFAFGMVVVQAFNGAGDTTTPTIVNLFCYWLWEIPLAYALAIWAGMGPRGVFLAIAIAESTTACVGILMFRRGTWKLRKI
jgi:putative MATE family efflux protein